MPVAPLISVAGRQLVRLAGADALNLLQKLATQDLQPLAAQDGALYSLLLNAQGRYLFDFFVIRRNGELYLDAPAKRTGALIDHINRYKLRSDIGFEPVPGKCLWLGAPGEAGEADPRHPQLGHRQWLDDAGVDDGQYEALRVRLGIVEPSSDMASGEDLPLDFGLDRLNAISFSKGCYPGQELTARTHHRGKARFDVKAVPIDEAGDDKIVASCDGNAIVQFRRATNSGG